VIVTYTQAFYNQLHIVGKSAAVICQILKAAPGENPKIPILMMKFRLVAENLSVDDCMEKNMIPQVY
jgi:hypothetical protein